MVSVQFSRTGRAGAALLVLVCGAALAPTSSRAARVTELTAGVSTFYDYDERLYRSEAVDDDADDQSSTASGPDNERYSMVVISPLLDLTSAAATNSISLHLAPRLSHDLLDDSTDVNGSVDLAARQDMGGHWQLDAGNNFLRSDESGDQQTAGTTSLDEPQLTDTYGRQRYWRNTTSLGSNFEYGGDRHIEIDAIFSLLRDDGDDDASSYQQYDRSTLYLGNDHRYTQNWLFRTGFTFVRGDFRPDGSGTDDSAASTQVAEDLREYHLLTEVDNTSFAHELLRLHYNHISTEYDEGALSDGYIHQMQGYWRHDFSPALHGVFGIGPTYVKTEGQDGQWAGNGRAEFGYSGRSSSCLLVVTKEYDVDNFSGTDEQGFVDTWDAKFTLAFQISEWLDLSGRLGYRTETLDVTQAVASNDATTADSSQTETTDTYSAGVAVGCSWSERYRLGVEYSFVRQDGEQTDDDYDDHRILVTVSWSEALFHWQ